MGHPKHIEWDGIGIRFRNSLAHGWFYRKKRNFVFYNNAKLRNGKNYTGKKLLGKCRIIQLNALCVIGNVGKLTELQNWGSKDPLTKSKSKMK